MNILQAEKQHLFSDCLDINSKIPISEDFRSLYNYTQGLFVFIHLKLKPFSDGLRKSLNFNSINS